MNEQLQNALSGLLTKTMEGVETASTFLVAELPDVVYQLLLWYGVRSIVETVLAISCVLFYIKLEKKLYPFIKGKCDKSYDSDFAFYFGYLGMGSIPRAILLAVAYKHMSLDWLQIWIAPKIWLLEDSATLIK